MILQIQKFNTVLKASATKYDADVLYYLISKVRDHEQTFGSESGLKEVVAGLEQWFKVEKTLTNTDISASVVTEGGRSKAIVNSTKFAEKKTLVITPEMVRAPEWIELMSLWNQIQAVSLLPISVKIERETKSFDNYTTFYEHVMESTKKGYYIQRYKGLGEMNPEQLWETTLNPVNRTLLQVNVGDAVAADETFSVLMGELVEPRRKFIHDNALMAKSLDV